MLRKIGLLLIGCYLLYALVISLVIALLIYGTSKELLADIGSQPDITINYDGYQRRGIGQTQVKTIDISLRPNLDISIANLHIDISYWRLYFFAFHLRNFSIDKLDVVVNEREEQTKPGQTSEDDTPKTDSVEQEPLNLPSILFIPFKLMIDQLLIKEITIKHPKFNVSGLRLQHSTYISGWNSRMVTLIDSVEQTVIESDTLKVSARFSTAIQLLDFYHLDSLVTIDPIEVANGEEFYQGHLTASSQVRLNPTLANAVVSQQILINDNLLACNIQTLLSFGSLSRPVAAIADHSGCLVELATISDYLPRIAAEGGIELELKGKDIVLNEKATQETESLQIRLNHNIQHFSADNIAIKSIAGKTLVSLENGKIQLQTTGAIEEVSHSFKNISSTLKKITIANELEIPFSEPESSVGTFRLGIFSAQVDDFHGDLTVNGSTDHSSQDNKTLNLAIRSRDFLDLNLSVSTPTNFASVKVDVATRFDSLERLWTLVRPFAIPQIPTRFVPSALAGRITSTGQVLLDQNPFNLEPDRLLEKLSLEFNNSIEMDSVKIPASELAFKTLNLENSISLQAQNLSISNQIDLANFNFKDDFIAIGKMGFKSDHSIKNLDIANLEGIRTTTTAQTNITHLQHLDFPKIDTISHQIKLSSQGTKTINVSRSSLAIPNLGLQTNQSIYARLNSEFFPNRFKAEIKTQINNPKLAALMIETKGSAVSELFVEYEGKSEIAIRGSQSFNNFSLDYSPSSKEYFRIASLDGTIPFQHSIFFSKDKKEILFEEPVSFRESPIVKSTFPSIAHLFPKYSRLTIGRVDTHLISMEDISLNLSLADNKFDIKNLEFSLLEGTGEINLQASFSNKVHDFNFDLNLVNIDSSKIITVRDQRDSIFGTIRKDDPFISTKINLLGNLTRKELNGDINVSRIGSSQMLALLALIDPNQSNSSFDSIRQALKIGNVGFVEIPIRDGFLGLEVDVSVAKVPVPLPPVSGIPVVQIIDSILSQNAIGEEVAVYDQI